MSFKIVHHQSTLTVHFHFFRIAHLLFKTFNFQDQTSISRVFRKIDIFCRKISTFLKIGNFRISKNIVNFKKFVTLAIPEFKQTSVSPQVSVTSKLRSSSLLKVFLALIWGDPESDWNKPVISSYAYFYKKLSSTLIVVTIILIGRLFSGLDVTLALFEFWYHSYKKLFSPSLERLKS